MAWPPPVLPVNRTDATPQQTTHPDDHNKANGAINDIVAHVQASELRPWVRTRSCSTTTVNASTNTALSTGGGVDVYDPSGLLTPDHLVIPAAGVGLWQVNVTLQIGSHASAAEVAAWIQDPTTVRYSQIQVVANGTKAQGVTAAALIPVTAGGQTIYFMAFNLNPSSIGVSIASLTAGRVGPL